MDELLKLISLYGSYYEMADDNRTWWRGNKIDRQVRALAQKLRREGYGRELDALMQEHPHLVSSPNGIHALAQ
jgi:hypothetical protein